MGATVSRDRSKSFTQWVEKTARRTCSGATCTTQARVADANARAGVRGKWGGPGRRQSSGKANLRAGDPGHANDDGEGIGGIVIATRAAPV